MKRKKTGKQKGESYRNGTQKLIALVSLPYLKRYVNKNTNNNNYKEKNTISWLCCAWTIPQYINFFWWSWTRIQSRTYHKLTRERYLAIPYCICIHRLQRAKPTTFTTTNKWVNYVLFSNRIHLFATVESWNAWSKFNTLIRKKKTMLHSRINNEKQRRETSQE